MNMAHVHVHEMHMECTAHGQHCLKSKIVRTVSNKKSESDNVELARNNPAQAATDFKLKNKDKEIRKLKNENEELKRDIENEEINRRVAVDGARLKGEELERVMKKLEEELCDLKALDQGSLENLGLSLMMDSSVLGLGSERRPSPGSAGTNLRNHHKSYRATVQRTQLLNFTNIYAEINIEDQMLRIYKDESKNEILKFYKIACENKIEWVSINELRKYRNKGNYEFAMNKMFKFIVENQMKPIAQTIYFIAPNPYDAVKFIDTIKSVQDIEPEVPMDLPPPPPSTLSSRKDPNEDISLMLSSKSKSTKINKTHSDPTDPTEEENIPIPKPRTSVNQNLIKAKTRVNFNVILEE